MSTNRQFRLTIIPSGAERIVYEPICYKYNIKHTPCGRTLLDFVEEDGTLVLSACVSQTQSYALTER